MRREVKAPKLKALVVNDPNDASLKWTGEQPMNDQVRSGRKSKPRSTVTAPTKDQVQSDETPKPRSRRKRNATRQKTFVIRDEEGLVRIAKKLGLSQAGVINLGLAMVIEKHG